MGVKIGISPIAWQNDDLPDLTAAYTMEQALQEARDIGYIGVERGQRMPSDTEGLLAYLDKYDIALCGGWCSGNLLVNDVQSEIAAIRQQVEQFVALGAPCIVYAECSNTVQADRSTPVNNRPTLDRTGMADYARKLTEVAKWVVDQGMPVAYHHHMGTIVESEQDVDWLMDASGPELSLCFDTGHLLYGGGDVPATLKRWGERVHHVHYKDIRPSVVEKVRKSDLSFIDGIIDGAFTVPGDGCIDFQEITDILKSLDFDGWIVVEAEQDPAKAPPYEYSKIGYDNIVASCRKAGLEIASNV